MDFCFSISDAGVWVYVARNLCARCFFVVGAVVELLVLLHVCIISCLALTHSLTMPMAGFPRWVPIPPQEGARGIKGGIVENIAFPMELSLVC